MRAEAERARIAHPRQLRRWSYVDRGFYTRQLERIWERFPKAQTLILRSDELRDAPERTLEVITRFLGVEAFAEVAQTTAHERTYERSMAVEEKDYLIDVFAEEVRSLERMLHWDCADWLC